MKCNPVNPLPPCDRCRGTGTVSAGGVPALGIPEGYTPCSACHGWGTPPRPMRPAPRRSTHARRPRTPRGFTRAGLTTRGG